MTRAAALLAIAIAAALAYFALSGRAPQRSVERSARHVLLVTIDTLRADRVGSYGYAAARTPVLDGIARRGTRFARAYATAPITLTSHASMMTGLLPPGHGARHNGIAVQADVPALAARFQQAGVETGAFVSAFPLDERFGLARGFATYDDELPRGGDGRRAVERPAAATVDSAIAWLRGRPPGARMFAWVHLFEPHAPYGEPGAPGAGDASSRYDGEIAIADREIGRLLNAWPDVAETLVVITSDHGEAFGEHGEIGHSIFVYDTTLQVPLVCAGPGVPASTVIAEPVTVADLAPTLAAFGGLAPARADGIDLGPVMQGRSPGARDLYAESFAPLVDFGWASLRSLRRDAFKLIAAPRPELYDVGVDGGERRNVVAERARLASELGAAIDRISGPDLSRQTPIDAGALARLRALGYASGGGGSGTARADPKDRIAIASKLASVISGEVRGEGAERALREVLQADPQNPQARQRLGFVLAEGGRCAEAERHFASAIASRLPSADPYLGLAMCHARRGAAARALSLLRDAREVEPGNAVVEANIGLMALQLGRVEEGIEGLTRALAIDPDLHRARFELSRALGRSGRRSEALRHASDLLARLPADAPQRPEVERLVAALRR